MTEAQRARCDAFRHLHETGIFVMPNPWDVGSAVMLQAGGFPALASTSAGAAFALGRPDGGLSVDEVLAHLRALAGATTVPLNADFEAGFSPDTATMAENVRRCVDTGVAGLSIEDKADAGAEPLYPFERALERAKAVRAAIDATGVPVVFTARCEAILLGLPNGFEEAERRLVAFAEAGADCLYAPGVRDPKQIAALVAAVAPKPLNVLVASSLFSVATLTELGVRRISVGSALARVAWGAVHEAARAITEAGTFERLGAGYPYEDLNALFATAET